MIKLIDILNEILTEKKLCKKGKAYYDRRIAAGEKPSAYLSGRAVKVCKGLMEEDDLEEVKIVPFGTAPVYKQYIQKFREKFGTFPRKLNLKIGKYNLSGEEYGIKLSWEEGKNFLSPITRRNVEYMSDYHLDQDPKYVYIGMVPDKYYSPEKEKEWTERGINLGFPRLSYYIVWETGDNNYPIAIARKETTSPMAGQTYLVSPIIKKQLSKFATDEFPVNSLFPPMDDDQQVNESLRDWFKKEDWVRIDTQGNITGPCGTMKKGKATTRCLPRKKAQSLTKAERAATSRKKVAGSKKGKQFVKNTKAATVRLKK